MKTFQISLSVKTVGDKKPIFERTVDMVVGDEMMAQIDQAKNVHAEMAASLKRMFEHEDYIAGNPTDEVNELNQKAFDLQVKLQEVAKTFVEAFVATFARQTPEIVLAIAPHLEPPKPTAAAPSK